MKIKATSFAMLVFKDVDRLEHDPHEQYKFNRFWAFFWGSQMFVLPIITWKFPHVWMKIEFFYVTQASLWANFATHFGAMSAALAADKTKGVVEDMSDGIDDIGKDTDVLRTAVGVEPVQG